MKWIFITIGALTVTLTVWYFFFKKKTTAPTGNPTAGTNTVFSTKPGSATDPNSGQIPLSPQLKTPGGKILAFVKTDPDGNTTYYDVGHTLVPVKLMDRIMLTPV